jgi:tetratricopeptide (TPR) repeat protein
MSVLARRTPAWILCVLCALAVKPSGAAEPWDTSAYPPGTQRRFQQAERLFRDGDHAASLALYQELAEKHPELPPAQIGWAASASRLGRYAEAASGYEAAVRLLPDDPLLEGELADACRGVKRYDDAEAWYRRALENSGDAPHRTRWHFGLGLIDSAAGRYPEAVGHYTDALAINPTLPIARHNMGVAFLKMNRLAEADAAFVDALSANPENVRAVFSRGQIAARNGDRGLAAELYARAAELRPDEPTFHHAQAQMLRRLGDADGADAALGRYRSTKAAQYRAEGRDFMAQEQWVDALAHLNKAYETDPTDIDSLTDRAYCLLRSGESELARREYERVLAARPGAARAMFHLAVALYHLQRHDEAEAKLLTVIAEAPDMPESYRQLAWVRRAQGDLSGAEDAFTMGLARNSKWAPGYWWRGSVRRQLGAESDAEADFRRAIQLTPDAPFPRESLARLLLDTGGDLAEARKHAASAVRKVPSPQHRVTLALIYDALGMSADASTEIERAHSEAPSDDRVAAARERIAARGRP